MPSKLTSLFSGIVTTTSVTNVWFIEEEKCMLGCCITTHGCAKNATADERKERVL